MNIQPIVRRLLLGLLISLPVVSMAESVPSSATSVDIEKLIAELPTKPENNQAIVTYYKAKAEEDLQPYSGETCSMVTVKDPVGNISGESAQIVTSTSVVIAWTTSTLKSSRVIYDTVSHLTLGSPPNYSYAFSTIENSAPTLNHSVTITGLTPNTTYYFRGVSRGSPEFVSNELRIITNK